MRVAYSKKHQKCEVAVVKEDKKRKIFLYFYASYHLFSKVQMEFRMVRSGLVKEMPAKTGYLRRFSESIQTRVKILIFVTLKIKTNQNKHAFYTFEGILNLRIIVNFCGVFWFSSGELINFIQFSIFATLKLGSSTALTVVACKNNILTYFQKLKSFHLLMTQDDLLGMMFRPETQWTVLRESAT